MLTSINNNIDSSLLCNLFVDFLFRYQSKSAKLVEDLSILLHLKTAKTCKEKLLCDLACGA